LLLIAQRLVIRRANGYIATMVGACAAGFWMGTF
jgi:hypothetical protein